LINDNNLTNFQKKKIKIKIQLKKKKFEKTSETMEELCFVISLTGLSRPNVGKDDYDYYANDNRTNYLILFRRFHF
jgi:hypothetical protein